MHRAHQRRPGVPASRRTRKYDLILFALPDSLTLVAGQSSLRLESYLFTKQAMQAAQGPPEAGRRRVRDVQLLPQPWLRRPAARTRWTSRSGTRPCVDDERRSLAD